MSEYQTLLFAQNDGLAKITLNRPDQANSMSLEMTRELMQVAIRCDADTSVRAVLLTANGKLFCAGGDIQAFADAGDDVSAFAKEVAANLHVALSHFARMRAPLIVAVNGAAAGAGFSLATAGDLVFAAASAKFSLAYTALGVSPDGGASYSLPRLIGLRRTQELLFTNRRLSAEEAQEWGIVNFVVADENLLQEAEALARKLADGPTGAFGRVKKLLLSSYDQGLEDQLAQEARGIGDSLGSADGREGVAAFLGKRAAQFTGN